MQINRISNFKRTYSTNTISMNGRIPDKSVIVNRVWKFLNENGLEFYGAFSINPNGMINFKHIYLGQFNHWFLKTEKGLKEIYIKDASSANELAYKFAEMTKVNKTIYNPVEANNQLGMALFTGLRGDKAAKGYIHTLKVPDFFAVI